MDERELLQRYLDDKSADAYSEIVRQNIDLVYAAARRQLYDCHLAEDVTQAVFLLFTRKAAGIKTPLAGWLIKATHYACRDARRIAARRDYHERQAMQSRPEQTAPTEPQWEEYAPFLDESLARLTPADRDAITLRFLRGLALREVGAAQNVTEEAARKRVDRALIRLRKLLSRRAAVPALALLSTALATRATQAAPLALAPSIATAGRLAAGTTADLLAHATAKALRLVQAKRLAALIAYPTVIFATTAILLAAFHPMQPTAKPPAKALAGIPNPAAAPDFNPDEDESRVPGQIQLARWDVLLDASELPNLQKISTPLQSSSKIYTAYASTGVALRRAVRNSIRAGTLIRASAEMEIASAWPPGKATLTFNNLLWFQHLDDPATPILLLGGSRLQNDTFARISGNRLHIKLDHPDMNVAIAELTANTHWINQPGQSLMYEGDLSAGQALAFIAQLPPVNGVNYVHVVVWESFQANVQQANVAVNQRGARWWCENGPSRLRHWADAASAWTARATHSTGQVAPAFQIKTQDGKMLLLEALCRPARWPFCWWDAQGNPVEGFNGLIPFHGDPPEGLWALFLLSGNAAEEKRMNPTAPPSLNDHYEQYFCQAIDAPNSLELGVAVGSWKQLAELSIGQPQTINGVTYTLDQPRAFADDQFLIRFLRSGVQDHDDLVIPTAADGRVAFTPSAPNLLFTRHRESRKEEAYPNYANLPLAGVKTWRLMERQRQWITFPRFAVEPKNPPATPPAR